MTNNSLADEIASHVFLGFMTGTDAQNCGTAIAFIAIQALELHQECCIKPYGCTDPGEFVAHRQKSAFRNILRDETA